MVSSAASLPRHRRQDLRKCISRSRKRLLKPLSASDMRSYLISFLLLALISCKDNKGIVAREENGDDPVYSITGEDPEMNRAIEKARNEFPLFVQILKKGESNVSDFSVKMRFDYDGDNGEHMWLSHIHMKADSLFGIL